MTIPRRFQTVPHYFHQARQRAAQVIGRYPFISFLALLVSLVALAAIGERLRRPEASTEDVVVAPQAVETFEIGGSPMVTVQAKIEKSGLITLVAQTGGVVQKIKTTEGQSVKKGHSLFAFSSTYQGASAPAVSRQISQKNYQFLVDSYQSQVDSISRNKEIARLGESQSSELREINRKSLDDSRALISLNESMLNYLDAQIRDLETTNSNGSNDAAIFQLQGSKSGILGALTNLRSGLRTLEYLNNNDQEAAKISQLSRDATIQQLELQEKTLTLNKEIAYLQVRLAQISESMMYPASPISGTVERIHVKIGQAVNPGTVLATIRGKHNDATAVVLLSQQMAQTVSKYDPSFIVLGDRKIEVLPRSISQEPTDGSLFSILYSVPELIGPELADGGYIEMRLPIALSPDKKVGGVFIPLDSVYQSQSTASVNIVDQTQQPPVAKNVQITLGQVTGEYVEVTSGLTAGDTVILDRSVVAGDQVTTK